MVVAKANQSSRPSSRSVQILKIKRWDMKAAVVMPKMLDTLMYSSVRLRMGNLQAVDVALNVAMIGS